MPQSPETHCAEASGEPPSPLVGAADSESGADANALLVTGGSSGADAGALLVTGGRGGGDSAGEEGPDAPGVVGVAAQPATIARVNDPTVSAALRVPRIDAPLPPAQVMLVDLDARQQFTVDRGTGAPSEGDLRS
jgi:hypothetical protein